MSADACLLRGLAAGDRQAFESIYLRHRHGLLDFVGLRYRLLDVHVAEDIVSEVFLIVWRDRARMASVRNLQAYLKAIGKNVVARRCHAGRPDEQNLPPEAVSPGSDAGAAMEQDELAGQIARAVNSLAQSHRLALELRQLGLSAKEIAARAGCTDKVAERRLEKARLFGSDWRHCDP